jgi:hypothetical protein
LGNEELSASKSFIVAMMRIQLPDSQQISIPVLIAELDSLIYQCQKYIRKQP